MSKKKATEAKLGELHGLITDHYITRMKKAQEGETELSAAELGNIARFLKDNGIEADPDILQGKMEEGGLLDTDEAKLPFESAHLTTH